jgi:hypothetical protein
MATTTTVPADPIKEQADKDRSLADLKPIPWYEPPIITSANTSVQFPKMPDPDATYQEYVLIDETNVHQYITDPVSVGEYLSACYDGPEFIWDGMGRLKFASSYQQTLAQASSGNQN